MRRLHINGKTARISKEIYLNSLFCCLSEGRSQKSSISITGIPAKIPKWYPPNAGLYPKIWRKVRHSCQSFWNKLVFAYISRRTYTQWNVSTCYCYTTLPSTDSWYSELIQPQSCLVHTCSSFYLTAHWTIRWDCFEWTGSKTHWSIQHFVDVRLSAQESRAASAAGFEIPFAGVSIPTVHFNVIVCQLN